MGNEITISQRLQEPFDSDDLEWRVQRCGITAKNKPWAMVVAYVTNRAIQQRLDDVLGFDGWQNEYQPSPDGKGFLCGISIRAGEEWITKWDGAENTNIEPLKGGLSGSMKRAAVQLGIGRYLYNLETAFAVCNLVDSQRDSNNNYAYHKDKQGNHFHIDWGNPELPEWALPNVEASEYTARIEESDSLIELKRAFADAWLHAKAFNREDLKDQFKESYEAVLARLDEAARMNVDEAYSKLSLWVQKQIKAFEHIPDSSSVDLIAKSYCDHVKTESEGQYYDTEPLLKSIREAQESRKSEILKQSKTSEEPEDE